MKNKLTQMTDPVDLNNYLVARFHETMVAAGIDAETDEWFEAQYHFFSAALAVYDYFDFPDNWQVTLYIENQLADKSRIWEIGTE